MNGLMDKWELYEFFLWDPFRKRFNVSKELDRKIDLVTLNNGGKVTHLKDATLRDVLAAWKASTTPPKTYDELKEENEKLKAQLASLNEPYLLLTPSGELSNNLNYNAGLNEELPTACPPSGSIK